MKDSRCGLSSFLERPKSFCLPGNTQGQGTGAHWLTSRNATNPSLALSQEDRKTDDRERDRDAGSNQEFGEPQDMACAVDPHYVLQAYPALWALPGRIRNSASLQLSSTSEMPRRPPTGVRPGEEKTCWWKKRPGDGSSSWKPLLLPTPLPGYGPGGPCVLRPLKPLILLAVCVSGEPSPVLLFPEAQSNGAGPASPARRQRKEKVFYIRYLFNSPF